MEKFWRKVNTFELLTAEGRQYLQEITITKSFKKGDLVLAEGEVCKSLYFVEHGLLRIFYIKEKKEITEWLALDDSFCFSIISFFDKVPSRLIIECLEDSEVICISRNGLIHLSDTNLEIARLFRKLITGSLIFSQVRMESIQFETAHQRYQRLLQQNPEILRRVPLMYIASFLGITVETLSRIRAHHH